MGEHSPLHPSALPTKSAQAYKIQFLLERVVTS